MKKSLVLLSFVCAFVIFLGTINIAKADVYLTPKKWTIAPYQTQELYIDNYSPTRDYEFYWMSVKRPGGTVDKLWGPDPPVTIPPGGRLTIKYPDDFLSPPAGWTSTGTGSTAEQGKYRVTAVGRTLDPWDVNTEWDVTRFSVVPEFTVSAMVILSLSFAGFLVFKRRFKNL